MCSRRGVVSWLICWFGLFVAFLVWGFVFFFQRVLNETLKTLCTPSAVQIKHTPQHLLTFCVLHPEL